MEEVLRLWNFEPSVIIGCILLFVAYCLTNKTSVGRMGCFLLGVIILFIALVSPLDVLSDNYLFSAHMVQHLLLLLIVPPILLLGLSDEFVKTLLNTHVMNRLEGVLGHWLVAWIAFNLALWIWHYPTLYDATLKDETVHIVEHLTFLTTAILFWWPLVVPHASSHLNPAGAVIYLVSAALSSTLLGIIITFARPGTYSAYLAPVDRYGLLQLIRESWGLDPGTDQELGGLIMWIVGGLVFLVAILAVIARWYRGYEVELSGTIN